MNCSAKNPCSTGKMTGKIPKPFFVANWKMNLLTAEAVEFCQALKNRAQETPGVAHHLAIAPSAIALSTVTEQLKNLPEILVGSQNCHWLESGAHTGELSPAMLKDVGAGFAIVGHSERRAFYGETDAAINSRIKGITDNGLIAILCIGETEDEYRNGRSKEVVLNQLAASTSGLTHEQARNVVLAYEPVWAIGTGLAATPEIAEDMHKAIRERYTQLCGECAGNNPILYGGSTKPENIFELLKCPNIDGALIGGASLKINSFWSLAENGLKGYEAAGKRK